MTSLRNGFVFPPGWPASGDGSVAAVPDAGAPVPIRRPVLDRTHATLLLEHLIAAHSPLQDRPVATIARALGAVGARFSDIGDALHRDAVEWVREETTLSAEGARQVVVGMAADWTADRLERMLRADFSDPRALDGFVEGPENERVRAVGGRLALHTCSGNVPGVGATSMLRSLLVKCPVLLKPGRTDIALPVLFAEALTEEDDVLSAAAAVVYWPHDRGGELQALALETADRVVAYGGDEAVERLRSLTPVTTPFLAYHHRLSTAVIGRSAIDSETGARETAERAAAAIGAYDSRGCVSPKMIWVEQGGVVDPPAWAEMLAAALAGLEGRIPAGRLGDGTLGAVRQYVDAVDVRAAAGEDVFARHAPDLSWTVIFGPPELAPPTGAGRAVVVCGIEDASELPGRLAPSARSLQSVGAAMEGSRLLRLAEALARIGVTRVTRLDRLAWPPAWWRHDGLGPLAALVRWTTTDAWKP